MGKIIGQGDNVNLDLIRQQGAMKSAVHTGQAGNLGKKETKVEKDETGTKGAGDSIQLSFPFADTAGQKEMAGVNTDPPLIETVSKEDMKTSENVLAAKGEETTKVLSHPKTTTPKPPGTITYDPMDPRAFAQTGKVQTSDPFAAVQTPSGLMRKLEPNGAMFVSLPNGILLNQYAASGGHCEAFDSRFPNMVIPVEVKPVDDPYYGKEMRYSFSDPMGNKYSLGSTSQDFCVSSKDKNVIQNISPGGDMMINALTWSTGKDGKPEPKTHKVLMTADGRVNTFGQQGVQLSRNNIVIAEDGKITNYALPYQIPTEQGWMAYMNPPGYCPPGQIPVPDPTQPSMQPPKDEKSSGKMGETKTEKPGSEVKGQEEPIYPPGYTPKTGGEIPGENKVKTEVKTEAKTEVKNDIKTEPKTEGKTETDNQAQVEKPVHGSLWQDIKDFWNDSWENSYCYKYWMNHSDKPGSPQTGNQPTNQADSQPTKPGNQGNYSSWCYPGGYYNPCSTMSNMGSILMGTAMMALPMMSTMMMSPLMMGGMMYPRSMFYNPYGMYGMYGMW